jgi:hypothetical protein
MQLDDDYTSFRYRFDSKSRYGQWNIVSIDEVLSAMIDAFIAMPFSTIAMSQGGDHIGGGKSSKNNRIGYKRKAMNSFLCDVDRPVQFRGRFNEDVNTYTSTQRAGQLYLTTYAICLTQGETQGNAGGITELYKAFGTYTKSFFSVMYCPSGVKVHMMGAFTPRVHHQVDWDSVAPCIIEEKWKKRNKE